VTRVPATTVTNRAIFSTSAQEDVQASPGFKYTFPAMTAPNTRVEEEVLPQHADSTTEDETAGGMTSDATRIGEEGTITQEGMTDVTIDAATTSVVVDATQDAEGHEVTQGEEALPKTM
jgi:hypothetical protein